MSFRRAIAVLALAAVSCFASDADGKWAGKIDSPNGAIPMSFDLKTDGSKLTGTAVGPQGEVAISDGIYDNGKITFLLKYHVYDTNVIFHYQGVVTGDHIDVMMSYGLNEPTKFTVKRVN